MLDWNDPLAKPADNTDVVEPAIVGQTLNSSALNEANVTTEQIPALSKIAPVNPER